AERAGAGVPPEVMQLVPGGRELGPADHPAVGRRAVIAVDHRHRVALCTGRVERRDVRERLGRSAHGGSRGPIEGGVRHVRHGRLLSATHRSYTSRPGAGKLAEAMDLTEFRQASHAVWEAMAAGWDARHVYLEQTARPVTERMLLRLEP